MPLLLTPLVSLPDHVLAACHLTGKRGPKAKVMARVQTMQDGMLSQNFKAW